MPRRVCTNSVNMIKNIPFPCRVRVQTVLMPLKTCVMATGSVCTNSVNGIKKKARENDDSAPPLKFNLASIRPSTRSFARHNRTRPSTRSVRSVLFCSVLFFLFGSARFETRERERGDVSLSRTTSRVPFRFQRTFGRFVVVVSRPGSRRRRRVDGRA